METVHKPVLLDEVIEALKPEKNKNYIDCTLGGGGHAEKLLEQTVPSGRILAFDADKDAIERTKDRLQDYGNRIIYVNRSYVNLKQEVKNNKFENFAGILMDLGLSSDQLQKSGRGFSFQVNEPLDMRFSTVESDLTAEKILNTWPANKIIKIFKEFGEEKEANKIVKKIVDYRKEKKIETTLQLVGIVVEAKKFIGKRHPATKVFQALRMAVNNELDNIEKIVNDSIEIMPTGARLAIITFHSLEEKIVKKIFKKESKECLCPAEIPVCRCEHKKQIKIVSKKIVPSEEEIQKNFRSRSAKLHVAEKI
jgi:16S rRNA (cytosine1402-N4)-methyltransferase